MQRVLDRLIQLLVAIKEGTEGIVMPLGIKQLVTFAGSQAPKVDLSKEKLAIATGYTPGSLQTATTKIVWAVMMYADAINEIAVSSGGRKVDFIEEARQYERQRRAGISK